MSPSEPGESFQGDRGLKINGREGEEKKGKPPGESCVTNPAPRGKKNQFFLPRSQQQVMEFQRSLWEFQNSGKWFVPEALGRNVVFLKRRVLV